MLLQKTLHMGQSLPDCKSRLANIYSYRRQFVMVNRAGQAERARLGRRALFPVPMSQSNAGFTDPRLQRDSVIPSGVCEVEGSLTICRCDYFSKNTQGFPLTQSAPHASYRGGEFD